MADLCTVDDVAQELRWRSGEAAKYGAWLQVYISAATPMIEDLAGPILPATITERHDGGSQAVALRNRPNAITSVSVGGVAVSGWTADLTAGLVYAGGRFAPGVQNVEVVYAVGGYVPENVRLAATALVAHMWKRSNPQVENPEDVSPVPQGFAVPNAVVQMLAPQKRLPGFA